MHSYSPSKRRPQWVLATIAVLVIGIETLVHAETISAGDAVSTIDGKTVLSAEAARKRIECIRRIRVGDSADAVAAARKACDEEAAKNAYDVPRDDTSLDADGGLRSLDMRMQWQKKQLIKHR